ncbi:MAG: cell division protein FtsZ [Alphaproteobacteria bacterium]|nr:cell division protein FtsZ [Alphaproteobacteria bacterium]MDF3034037.1 cell division protein FtsZ [Alphaproteobacteria bacterium]
MSVANLELRPRITVIGVGGAGGNAVCNMIRAKLEGVEFVVANTDAQALSGSLVEPARKIQLGLHVTQGLGAGSKPDVGRASAEESHEEIIQHLRGSNMVFITAGMGGGTGTGAAPVIARAAREEGILTVGVVTKPFHFEGTHRSRTAERGIEELQQYVDTLIIIPNQNLFRIANERTTFADAFKMADDVLYSGVRGVTDLMMMPGLINLDFADIRAVMAEMGKAMMGTGEAEGDRRALDAAEAAISNPLLDDVSMKGAKGVLINITGGYDMTLYEVDEAANRIRDEVDPEANIIFGSTFDEKLNGTIRVSVVATGIGGLQALSKPASAGVASAIMARPINLAAASTAAREPASSNSVYYGPSSQKTPMTDPTPDAAPYASSEEKEFEVADGANLQTERTSTEASEPLGFETSPDVYQEPEPSVPSSTQETSPFPVTTTTNRAATAAPEPVNSPEERRRPTSLFERFTGVSRAKAPQPQPEIKKVVDTEAADELDMLEIPAFLRRGA